MTKREEYAGKLKHKLDDWSDGIEKLEVKAGHAKDDMKLKYVDEIEFVRHQRDNVKDKTMELVESSEEAWAELKIGVGAAWHTLTEAIDRAHSKF